ncbi:hypothetical protein GF412_05715 [Candidatus Micrarchaeota archaeon]|nr:hypothetical protein [Candidatus Micrarchaeota archaeon]
MGLIADLKAIYDQTKENRRRTKPYKPYINPNTQGSSATAAITATTTPNDQIDHHTPGAGSGDGNTSYSMTGEFGPGYWNVTNAGVYWGHGEGSDWE